MINVEKLKQEALRNIQTDIEDIGYGYREKIKEEFIQHVFEAKEQLQHEIETVNTEYKKLELQGKAGALEWIYLSFLRTSLLDCSPCYRIDFYDSRGCISDEECSGSLNFNSVFNSYHKLKKYAMDLAKRQSRLTPYEVDDILESQLAAFRSLADDQISCLIHLIHKDFSFIPLEGCSIKIMLGEYLDKTELIDEILPYQ